MWVRFPPLLPLFDKVVMKKSPERNTFQKENYLRRQAEKGLTPENDKDTRVVFEYYQSWDVQQAEKEADPAWRKNNMEYDLRSTDWICAKAKNSESYAQNLYAAMCNQEFQKIDVWPILKGETWGCSWRYAGGIVADMREQGDYIDWYCSGIRGALAEPFSPTPEQVERMKITEQFVGEGCVTDEVRQDLLKLGWAVVDDEE